MASFFFVSNVSAQELNVRQIIELEFKNDPVMIEIARCESTWSQFRANGNVLRGIVNPKDVGAFQINEYWHLADSKKLGYNIYTIEGNIKMAKHLRNKQGTKPWNASKNCWSKTSTLA